MLTLAKACCLSDWKSCKQMTTIRLLTFFQGLIFRSFSTAAERIDTGKSDGSAHKVIYDFFWQYTWWHTCPAHSQFHRVSVANEWSDLKSYLNLRLHYTSVGEYWWINVLGKIQNGDPLRSALCQVLKSLWLATTTNQFVRSLLLGWIELLHLKDILSLSHPIKNYNS